LEGNEDPVLAYEYDFENGYFWGANYYEELPIYVNKWANLCTNMYQDVPEEMARILTAMNDGIFDPSITAIDDTTDMTATTTP